MANTFKNAGVAVGSSATTIYTAPGSTTGVIHAVYISNVDGANDATIDLYVTDTSAGSDFYIMKTVDVPADSTLVVIDKNSAVYLEEGDTLEGGASANGDLTCVVNFEILNDA